MATIDATNPYVAGLLLVAVVDLGMAAYAVARRDEQGARAVALILNGAGIWSLAYAWQLSTVRPAEVPFALGAMAVATSLIAHGVLVFGLEYSGRRFLVTLRRRAVVGGLNLLVFVLAATNPVHGLLWTLGEPTRRSGLSIWALEFSVTEHLLAFVFLVWIMGTAATGVGLVVQLARQTGDLYRRQLVPFGAAMGVLVLGDLAYLAGLSPVEGLIPTPYLTGVAAVILAAGVFEFDMFERSPVAPSRAHDVAVASLGTPVLVVDGDGILVHHNPAADELFAADVREVGDPLADHFPALAERLADVEGPFEADLVETARGRRRHFAVRATPADPGWVVSLLDVTDRVLREQRMAVLYRLLRHNVRNETSVVMGHADHLAGHDDAEVAEAGEAILEAARTLSGVSEEAGRMNSLLEADAEPEAVDAAAAVGDIVEAARADHPGATVELSAPDRAMTRCHVSVRDAVAELVENAVVHHDGDPHVEMTVEDGDEWVTVTVADDGPGIPDEELAAIRDGRETQLVHASGVGLWLVSWTTAASGGRVTFGDNEPRGTVVRLELPAA